MAELGPGIGAASNIDRTANSMQSSGPASAKGLPAHAALGEGGQEVSGSQASVLKSQVMAQSPALMEKASKGDKSEAHDEVAVMKRDAQKAGKEEKATKKRLKKVKQVEKVDQFGKRTQAQERLKKKAEQYAQDHTLGDRPLIGQQQLAYTAGGLANLAEEFASEEGGIPDPRNKRTSREFVKGLKGKFQQKLQTSLGQQSYTKQFHALRFLKDNLEADYFSDPQLGSFAKEAIEELFKEFVQQNEGAIQTTTTIYQEAIQEGLLEAGEEPSTMVDKMITSNAEQKDEREHLLEGETMLYDLNVFRHPPQGELTSSQAKENYGRLSKFLKIMTAGMEPSLKSVEAVTVREQNMIANYQTLNNLLLIRKDLHKGMKGQVEPIAKRCQPALAEAQKLFLRL